METEMELEQDYDNNNNNNRGVKRALKHEKERKAKKKKKEEKKKTWREREILDWTPYKRPRAPDIDPEKDSILFQSNQIDYTLGERSPTVPSPVPGQVPIIRTWGVTKDGNSVQCNVYGFMPYFYLDCPSGFTPDMCDDLAVALNSNIHTTERTKDPENPSVISVVMDKKASIQGYAAGELKDFIKVTLCTPKIVTACRSLVSEGITIRGNNFRFATFESNVAFTLRFMTDIDLIGAGWMELKPGTYSIIKKGSQRSTSECQIEVDVKWDLIVAHSSAVMPDIPPIRELSFDLESAGRKGIFPEADTDPVIQIAAYLHVHGRPKDEDLIKVIFCLREVSALPAGYELRCFEDEREMLLAFSRFLREVDPDILLGYNIANFDLPYLLDRAKRLGILEAFSLFGRLSREKVWKKRGVFSSKAYGNRETMEVHVSGRVILDILVVIQRDHKLRSYTLNNVAFRFLKQRKEGIDHNEITPLFNGTADDRRRLAIYCLKDAYLPLRLLHELMMLYNQVEMARVTGVPLDYLYQKGQQIKVVSQILRDAKKDNMLMPYYVKEKGVEEEDTYEGASVLEPKRGFYTVPVATLDFASLYPTIMIAHNLCYSTLLTRAQTEKMDPAEYEVTPQGHYFVRRNVRCGILPRILENLLSARDEAKRDLAKESDPFKKAVFDGRQLALKVSANSVYGFTGAIVGKLPCIEISAGVTAYGREMIYQVKSLVEAIYTVANGHPCNSEVIYGDTDSVMVIFGVDSIAEAMKLGKDAAKRITDNMNMPPIKLAFEKVYCPYLLISKKRYAGLFWTKPEKHDKLDSKGLETVRRDVCKLTSDMMDTVLKHMLIDKDVEKAKEYVKATVSNLLQDKIDLSLLVITKGLTKPEDQYKNKQPHTELAKKMADRDSSTAPVMGDRVKYVMVTSTKGAKGYEKAEDPMYVLEHDLTIDYDFYLEKQLKKPMMRVFKAVMDKPESLIYGEHTKKRVIKTSMTGMMGMFVQKKPTCISCNALLKGSDKSVCPRCKSKERDIYEALQARRAPIENRCSTLTKECQVCQGTDLQQVPCSNNDCSIFYERTKVKKDLDAVTDKISRFDVSW